MTSVSMQVARGLGQLVFDLQQSKATTQGILLASSVPNSFYFECCAKLSDFPFLDLTQDSPSLISLVYSTPNLYRDSNRLKQLFTAYSEESFLLFTEKATGLSIFYVLTLCGLTETSLVKFRGAEFALFRFQSEEIIGTDCESYFKLIKILKRYKAHLICKLQDSHEVENNKEEELKEIKKTCEYFERRRKLLTDEIENAKVAVQQMTFQVQKKKDQVEEMEKIDIMCCECRTRKRNAVLLPCGHLPMCDACTTRKSKEEKYQGTERKRVKLICPVCSGEVHEIKEALFSYNLP
jgi:hypothetical protein